jgi:hypothetical protein
MQKRVYQIWWLARRLEQLHRDRLGLHDRHPFLERLAAQRPIWDQIHILEMQLRRLTRRRRRRGHPALLGYHEWLTVEAGPETSIVRYRWVDAPLDRRLEAYGSPTGPVPDS